MLLRLGCAFFALFLFTCSASRKISQVGLREPDSVQKPIVFSETRARLAMGLPLPPACPKEFAAFSTLAVQRVLFPACPLGLPETFQLSLTMLTLEERSTIEEMLNSRCRSLGTTEYGNSLENILNAYESTGPIGRRNKITQTVQSMEADFKLLASLKASLYEISQVHLPLDRWTRLHGEFVIPDEDLELIFDLVQKNACRFRDQQIDGYSSAMRNMEELVPLLKDQNQQTMLIEFLKGFQSVIDKKLQEYFFP